VEENVDEGEVEVSFNLKFKNIRPRVKVMRVNLSVDLDRA
jgi:hypothetical protein